MSSQLDTRKNLVRNYMLAGLVPFFVLGFGLWVMEGDPVRLGELFFLYSTMILVFLSGVLWAFALSYHQERQLHAAIVFSLWPLPAHFLPDFMGIFLMAVGFLLLLLWERKVLKSMLPLWYSSLRVHISWLVVICHLAVVVRLVKTTFQ